MNTQTTDRVPSRGRSVNRVKFERSKQNSLPFLPFPLDRRLSPVYNTKHAAWGRETLPRTQFGAGGASSGLQLSKAGHRLGANSFGGRASRP